MVCLFVPLSRFWEVPHVPPAGVVVAPPVVAVPIAATLSPGVVVQVALVMLHHAVLVNLRLTHTQNGFRVDLPQCAPIGWVGGSPLVRISSWVRFPFCFGSSCRPPGGPAAVPTREGSAAVQRPHPPHHPSTDACT